MPRHTLVIEPPEPGASRVTVRGEEAKHALRVKRLREGETVRVLDGRGHAWIAGVVEARRELVLELGEREDLPALRPRLEMVTASPKGQRLDKMIDQLGQLGVAAWRPLHSKLGVVEPGENKLERMRRIAGETVKQAILPRAMEIGDELGLDEAVDGAIAAGVEVVAADPLGESYRATGAGAFRVLIGPEGGFTVDEQRLLREKRVRLISLGPTVLRIETAAVAAAAVLLDREREAIGADHS